MFFFFFGNVVKRGKNDDERSIELLDHLDETAFEFYFDKCAVKGSISDPGKDYYLVKAAILDKFVKEAGLQEIIR